MCIIILNISRHTLSLPSDWLTLDTLVRDMALLMQYSGGVQYSTGSISSQVYIASGGSVDYAYDQGYHGIRFWCQLLGIFFTPQFFSFFTKFSFLQHFFQFYLIR